MQRFIQFAIFLTLFGQHHHLRQWKSDIFKILQKMSTIVFEKCKVLTSYNLYSACIYYLDLKNLQNGYFNIDIKQKRDSCKHENALESMV